MLCQNNDNSQTWVRARNLKVDNARVNITPKKLDLSKKYNRFKFKKNINFIIVTHYAKTNYTHIILFDENENLIDILGNIVSKKELSWHIPYNN